MKNGRIYQLFAPLLVLVISTVALLLYTGAQGATSEGLPVTILNMMEYTDIGLSLVIGSAIGLLVSLIVTLTAKPIIGDFGKAIKAGVKSMLPAIGILILAWTTIDMIGRLGTGNF